MIVSIFFNDPEFVRDQNLGPNGFRSHAYPMRQDPACHSRRHRVPIGMQDLLSVPIEERDEDWDEQFFKQLTSSQFEFLSDSPIEGPDGMPYLAVKITEDGEPTEKVLEWLGEKGAGLAINPDKEQPDYVFSYGMIWNFLLHGEFITPADNLEKRGGKDFEITPGQEMMAGTPSESYLPPHVRGLFKEFLVEQGVLKPRIVMLSQDGTNYDLCFSLESLGSPPEEEWQGVLEAFSWFFPLHYSFSILSEEMIQGVDFIEL